MAQVKVASTATMQVTDYEWKLIMKALAVFAGIKVSHTVKQQKDAEILNHQLLGQRRADLRDQLQAAEQAWAKSEQALSGQVLDLTDLFPEAEQAQLAPEEKEQPQ